MSNQLTTNQQGFAPVTLDEAMRFSDMLAKSSMVPKQYQGKPEDVLVAVQWGKELGLAPLQALQNIACINGKPSVYGDAAMALAQNSPVCEGIEEFFEGEGTTNPVAVCVAHRKNRTPVTAKFSVEDAKRAGLWGKQGPWQAYPKRMLQMRARGFALRDAYPDVLKGLITAEEAQDYPDEVKPAHKAVMRNPLDALAQPKPPEVEIPVTLPVETLPVVNEMDGINALMTEASVVDEDGVITEEHSGAEATPEEPVEESHAIGEWLLQIPGKEPSSFPDQPSWSAGYEALAEKVTKAAKIQPRDRMTKLRELREANEDTLKKVSALERIHHTAAYSKRLAALGAKLGEGATQ